MSMRSSQHIDLMNFLGKFGFTMILASPPPNYTKFYKHEKYRGNRGKI